MLAPAPRLWLVSFATAALVIVGACGGDDDDGADAAVSAADGGTVSSADGALTLEIPAGALASDTEIAIERVPSEDLDQEIRDAEPVGPVYRLTPDGLVLDEPVKLIFALSADDVLAGVSEDEFPVFLVLSRSDDGEWDIARDVVTTYDFETGAATVEAEVFHFSTVMTRYSPDIVLRFSTESIDTTVGTAWHVSLQIRNRGTRVFLLGAREAFASGVVSVVGAPSVFRETFIAAGSANTKFAEFTCESVGEGGFGISNTVSIALDRAAAEELMLSLGGLTLARALDVIIIGVEGEGHATCSARAVAPASPLTPTATAPPPAETASPTATAPPPAETPSPTETAPPPTETPPPPTETPSPTATAPPPTETAPPTATAPPPTETASPNRPPVVTAIAVTVSLPVTTYKIVATDPDGDPLTITWSGPNCGSVTGSTAPTMMWSHGSDVCPHTTVEHEDATIRVLVSDGEWDVTCRYVGAESGAGQACDAPVRSP